MTTDTWRAKHHRHGLYRVLSGNRVIADHIGGDDPATGDGRQRAELIAAAANNHASLIAALRELTFRTGQFIRGALIPQCEAAIRAAGAQPLSDDGE